MKQFNIWFVFFSLHSNYCIHQSCLNKTSALMILAPCFFKVSVMPSTKKYHVGYKYDTLRSIN